MIILKEDGCSVLKVKKHENEKGSVSALLCFS